MPGAHHDDLHGSRPAAAARTYFNVGQPTFTALQTGLAALGFLLVLRFFTRRLYSWLRQPRTSPPHLAAEKASPIVSWERYSATYSGDIATMKSNTTRLSSSEPDSAQTELPSRARMFSRPAAGHEGLPPAPPLTPPELSSTIYSVGEERSADMDGFMSQPNPDYLSTSEPLPPEAAPSSAPKRRSHIITLPISIPTPQASSLSARDAASSSPEHAFAPSSYPPTSPLLPPAPPGDQGMASEDHFPRRSVDVKGEIISVLDGDGAGWTRHTRVYGGGACLACAASTADGHEGGFYGVTVTPEEMR